VREHESLKLDMETVLRTEIDSILMQWLTQKSFVICESEMGGVKI
jgi:predicted transcriptional regulator